MEKVNIHAGHRERMIKKFMQSPREFSEHELLEILLFPIVPRKDTNAFAHKLLNVFGSLEKVLKASPRELMLVDGVGEKVAWYVSLYGQIVDRCGGTIQTKKNAKGGVSYFQNIETVKSFFEQTYLESCVIILYDINYKIITSLQFNNKSASFVKGDIPELVSAITTTKAKYLLIAHNHLSGNPEPSESDDVATLKILGLAGYHGVEVLDHIIVTKGDSYSYYYSGKLEKIKAQTDLSKVVKIDE